NFFDGAEKIDPEMLNHTAVLYGSQDAAERFDEMEQLRKDGGNINGFTLWLFSNLLGSINHIEKDENQTSNYWDVVNLAEYMGEVAALKGGYAAMLEHLPETMEVEDFGERLLTLTRERIREHMGSLEVQDTHALSVSALEKIREAFREYRTLLKHSAYFQWRSARAKSPALKPGELIATLEAWLDNWYWPRENNSNRWPYHGTVLVNSGMSSFKVLVKALSQIEDDRTKPGKILAEQNAYYETVRMLIGLQHSQLKLEELNIRDQEAVSRKAGAEDVSMVMLDHVSNAYAKMMFLQPNADKQPRGCFSVNDIRQVIHNLTAGKTFNSRFFLAVDISLITPDFNYEKWLEGIELPLNFHVVLFGSVQKLHQNGLELTSAGMLQVLSGDPAQHAKVIAAIQKARDESGNSLSRQSAFFLEQIWTSKSQILEYARRLKRNTEEMAQLIQTVMRRHERIGVVIHPSLPNHPNHGTWLSNGEAGIPVIMLQLSYAFRDHQKELFALWSKYLRQAGIGGLMTRDSFGFEHLAISYYWEKTPYEAVRISMAPLNAAQLELAKKAFELAYEEFYRTVVYNNKDSNDNTASLAYWCLKVFSAQGKFKLDSGFAGLGLLGGAVEAVGLAAIFSLPLASISWIFIGLWLGLTVLHLPLMVLAGLRGRELVKAFGYQTVTLLGYGVLSLLGLKSWLVFWAGAHVIGDLENIFKVSDKIKQSKLWTRAAFLTRAAGLITVAILVQGLLTPFKAVYFLGKGMFALWNRVAGKSVGKNGAVGRRGHLNIDGSRSPVSSLKDFWTQTSVEIWAGVLKFWFDPPSWLTLLISSPLVPLLLSGDIFQTTASTMAVAGGLHGIGRDSADRQWVESLSNDLLEKLAHNKSIAFDKTTRQKLAQPGVQKALRELSRDLPRIKEIVRGFGGGSRFNNLSHLQTRLRGKLKQLIENSQDESGDQPLVLSSPQQVAEALRSRSDEFQEIWKTMDSEPEKNGAQELKRHFLDAATQVYNQDGLTAALGLVMPLASSQASGTLVRLLRTRPALTALADRVERETTANFQRAQEQRLEQIPASTQPEQVVEKSRPFQAPKSVAEKPA
ncbi:MAG: hypothetical protein HGA76_10110, partial [Candidatus Firestonebacteria bacterium]|nr:hypothetical protein [Candidatus Firestonebacteria bacterium]